MVVRVYGHLRVFQGQKSVVAFAVSPVTDFNEITFHILDIVHTHLALTKATNIPNVILVLCVVARVVVRKLDCLL